MRLEVHRHDIKNMSFTDSAVEIFELNTKQKLFKARCTHGYIGSIEVSSAEIEISDYENLVITQSSGEGWNPRNLAEVTKSDHLDDICEFFIEGKIVRIHGFSKKGWNQFVFTGGTIRAFYEG